MMCKVDRWRSSVLSRYSNRGSSLSRAFGDGQGPRSAPSSASSGENGRANNFHRAMKQRKGGRGKSAALARPERRKRVVEEAGE